MTDAEKAPAPWFRVVRETVLGAVRAGLTDRAAALSYYSALSIFPAIIFLVALVGLVGDSDTAGTLLDAVGAIGPESAVTTLREPIEGLTSDNGAAGIALAISLGAALWAASGYVGALIRSANEIAGLEDGRSFARLLAVRTGLTVLSLTAMAAMLVAIAISGPILDSVSEAAGIGDAGSSAWSIGRWPLLALAAGGVIAAFYRFGPAIPHHRRGSVVIASAVALAAWAIASAGFALYVANLGSYDAVYGSLAGAIVFLVWLWVSNMALLCGAALSARLASATSAVSPRTGSGVGARPAEAR